MPALSGAEGSPLSEAKGLPIAFITAIAATKCWLGLVGETVNLVFLFVAFLFGASLGSFLNVVIDRIPLDKSLVRVTLERSEGSTHRVHNGNCCNQVLAWAG